MKRQIVKEHLKNIRQERRKLHEMERQFSIVDSSEMVSSDTRDKWWIILQDYIEKRVELER